MEVGPAGGTLILNPDGSFTCAPNAGFWGTEAITYTIMNGSRLAPATLTILVTAVGNAAPMSAED